MLRIAILIDGGSDKDQYLIVRRWLSLMLLFGAMVGLLAQEVAFASAPAMSSAAVTASQMSDECAEMMKAATSQGDKPCKGLTDRKSTRLNSRQQCATRMQSSA